ncbi:MAG TPA: sugar phosphate nucleotidyltransferase [Candidatus Hydrogenedentes bacterium]|nr:sugar phosphate nucleotidyltransferase [Candidatus Hydrogenedentota bacterium]
MPEGKTIDLGVILAAGRGARMGPFGASCPKPIAPVANEPLAERQIRQLRGLGVREVVVVIGHLGHMVSRCLGDGSRMGVSIRYVEQERPMGLAHAVSQLEGQVDRPFYLMLGDLYFELEHPERLAAAFLESGCAAAIALMTGPVPPERQAQDFAVHLDGKGLVRRVIEKPRYLQSPRKGCGFYLFDLPIFDAIRNTPRTALRDEFELTVALQTLVDFGCSVAAAPVVAFDLNVTTVADLIACSRRALASSGRTHVIGEGCEIADRVRLEETAVGDRARIVRPVCLRRCVVLPDAVVDAEEDLEDLVITPEARFSARS